MASLSAAFSCRLFSVLRFESVIHEFDPYFNYRTTKFLAEEGFYNFHNWFDDRAWYPLGRIIGGIKERCDSWFLKIIVYFLLPLSTLFSVPSLLLILKCRINVTNMRIIVLDVHVVAMR